MEVTFEQLPDTARIWIYQADRAFTKNEKEIISSSLSSFLQQWTAHGNTLKAGFDLPYGHFIVIGLDEKQAGASGCSIDGLFRTLQTVGTDVGINFFDRNLIAFKKNDNVMLLNRQQLKERASEWNGETVTFNNLISAKADLQTLWMVPAGTTWLKRYLAPASV